MKSEPQKRRKSMACGGGFERREFAEKLSLEQFVALIEKLSDHK
jgi:hypothetical protein